MQPEKTCCFTGHRPQFFPWGSNTGDPAAAKMLRALESEILQAIADSYTTFLYGGALGVDAWAAGIVLRLRKNLPLTLIAILPFPGYNADVTENSYRPTIAASDRILCVGPGRRDGAFWGPGPGYHYWRLHPIAVYDEHSRIHSGTWRALCYARKKQLGIRQIRWMEYL
mgnify:CR=1 FL=1